MKKSIIFHAALLMAALVALLLPYHTFTTLLLLILAGAIAREYLNSPRAQRKDIVLLIICSLLVAVLGLGAPALSPNHYYGIRLPWVLGDTAVWHKTHMVMRSCAIPIAVIMLIIGPFFHPSIIAVGGLLALAAIPVGYSIYYYIMHYYGRVR